MVDVTAICKTIGKAVRDLCTGSKRQTLLYMGEVFKGSNTTKVRSYQHDKTPYFASLQNWQLHEIHRLMHKLVLEDYLQEELIFIRDIPQAYLRLGKNIDKLMNGSMKIEFATLSANKKKKSAPGAVPVAQVVLAPLAAGAAASTATAPLVLDAVTASKLSELKDSCHNDLLDACRKMAAQKNVTMVSVMNMQAIKAMSDRMPESEAEMLQIPHVTQANFVKYGKDLLIITQQYAAEKMCKWFAVLELYQFNKFRLLNSTQVYCSTCRTASNANSNRSNSNRTHRRRAPTTTYATAMTTTEPTGHNWRRKATARQVVDKNESVPLGVASHRPMLVLSAKVDRRANGSAAVARSERQPPARCPRTERNWPANWVYFIQIDLIEFY